MQSVLQDLFPAYSEFLNFSIRTIIKGDMGKNWYKIIFAFNLKTTALTSATQE